MIFNQYIGNSRFKKINEPVVGYKRSRIRLVQDDAYMDKIFLSPIQAPQKDVRIPLNAVSDCPFTAAHTGNPTIFCDCGFYSYTNLDDAMKHLPQGSYPMLKTVSSGKIVLYGKGVRAAKQRVAEVIIPTECSGTSCPLPADRLWLYSVSSKNFHISGVCKHHGDEETSKTFTWLQDRINDSFTNGEPEVKVRSINESVIPWDGSIKPPVIVPVVEDPVERKKRIATIAAFAGAIALACASEIYTWNRNDTI